MTKLTIAVTIISETPLSIGAGGSAGTLADKSIVRDGWNRPIIPGSQLKGKVRHAAESIARSLNLPVQHHFDDDSSQSNVIRCLFGSPAQRSPLYFADLIGVIGPVEQLQTPNVTPEQLRIQIRPSVSINRRRGVAEEARLLFQETALEVFRFHSARAITGTVPSLPCAALLWAALKITDRWGGAKSRGLGWSKVETQVRIDGQDVDDATLSQALRELVMLEGCN